MDAVLDIVARLKASLRWFAAAPELRLLHVVADDDLRIALLQNLAAAELTARSRRPFLFVEAPVEPGPDGADDGWSLRAEELVEELLAAQDRMQAQQPGLRFVAVEPPPAEVAGEPAADQLARFAVTLRRVLDALPAELDGLVVVLAPLLVARPAVLRDGLALLIARPELAAVKWIVFETGAGPTAALADRLGARAERLDARVDPAATRASLAAMLAAMRSAPAGAEGYRLAGMAGPRELPPPRRGRVPADPAAAKQAVAAALSSAGVAPALADSELMQRLRIQVLAASEAAQEARYPEAVRLQAEARDICVGAGLLREAVVLELVLGSYALHGGATDLALRVFDQAHGRAAAGGLIDLAAQAQIAKGGTLLLQRQRPDAALAYLAAGNTAATLASPILAIEAFRLAGTVLLGLRNEEQAIAAWRRAVAIAEASPEEKLAGSSAPAAARSLAEVCRRHNLVAQADSLIAQAAAWEAAASAAPAPPPDSPELAPASAAGKGGP